MSYKQIKDEDERLEILRALAEDSDYSLNNRIIGAVLASVGHNISNDKLITQLAWLNEQGLIETEEVGKLIVSKLTQRGGDVAAGRARVPGVRRLEPGE